MDETATTDETDMASVFAQVDLLSDLSKLHLKFLPACSKFWSVWVHAMDSVGRLIAC
jgi:hypothetical protein